MYTYEDLKKAPVGTKITIENGEILVKCDETKEGRPSMPIWKNNIYFRDDYDLKYMDAKGWLGKIIKVEEPIYKKVYECKDILDDREKEYLNAVINPFREKVEYIQKSKSGEKNCEYIKINYSEIENEGYFNSICLPNFKKNTMYKKMELNKKYSLMELFL